MTLMSTLVVGISGLVITNKVKGRQQPAYLPTSNCRLPAFLSAYLDRTTLCRDILEYLTYPKINYINQMEEKIQKRTHNNCIRTPGRRCDTVFKNTCHSYPTGRRQTSGLFTSMTKELKQA